MNSEPIERKTKCNLALQSMNTSVGLDSSKRFQTNISSHRNYVLTEKVSADSYTEA